MQYTDRLIATYEKYAHKRTANAADSFKEVEKEVFKKYLVAEKRQAILEVGCGPGYDAKSFQEQGLRILAIDNTPAMVELAKEKGVPAQMLDCYDLEQIDATFDAVYSMNCLLHVPQKDLGQIFHLLSDRLNERGLMYLGLWGGEDFEGVWQQDPYEPKRFFSLRSAKTLFSAAQQLFRVEYYRRIEANDGDSFFNSLIVRKR